MRILHNHLARGALGFYVAVMLLLVGVKASAQEPTAPPQGEQNNTPDASVEQERWNLFYQATSIGQYHGTFHSPYAGAFSLQDTTERDVSITTTLFFGLRLAKNTVLYFDPEIAGGRGFSGVNGLANSSNGELPRVASATPKPYLARLYISQDFALGDEMESFESDENQLAGQRPMNRYTVTAGRFTLTDFFDNNRYSHDPRTQFMGWAVMFNGAWDYPADVRGYDWGWVHELHLRNWSFRYASAAMPRVANGLRFDRRLLVNRGDVFEAERRWDIRKHTGAVRLLNYENRANAGTYAEALRLAALNGGAPNVIATRRNGTLKYGFGVNAEQEITGEIGVFARLGWNDGKTESFAFTAVDRLATGGVSVTGKRWRRPFDTVATEVTASGISGVHALYLARGGYDFLIGDGHLQYGPETIWESYYNARLLPWLFATIDVQHVTNPAYNEDRGPLWISSLRLHVELGKDTFAGHPKH
ncbi:MAG TPA: carbohydrate porin [Bryobacteraceae bacterium]|nr:carbohydrate porin [Bryobacteraceae bacterium]